MRISLKPSRSKSPAGKSALKVLIADDHAVVRQGLKQILADSFRHATFGEARNAQEALEHVWSKKWDIVILDINMPGRSGLDALKELRNARPSLPVLVLSVYPEDQFAIRVLKAGASGYMGKESAPEDLIRAIHKVLAGGRYVSATLAEKLAQSLSVPTAQAPHETLSNREYEVLSMIAAGITVKQIALKLSLSAKTISTYRTRILEKMGLKTTAELIHYAIQNNLVE